MLSSEKEPDEIVHAKRLLVETDLPFKVIAGRVGFPSYKVFHTKFKNQTGITLGEYRKREQEAGVLPDKIVQAQRLLAETKLSVKAIAGQVHYASASALLKGFKNATGVAPSEYREHVRIDRAKKLLAETKLSVKAIAGQVHYASTFALYIAFKNATGIAPSEYRKREQEAGVLPDRIVQAQALLTGTDEPVEVIADRVYYASASTLCVAFKNATGMTPSEYRTSVSLKSRDTGGVQRRADLVGA